jgi:hypothetical protein
MTCLTPPPPAAATATRLGDLRRPTNAVAPVPHNRHDQPRTDVLLNPPGNDKSSDDALEYRTVSLSDQLFRSSLQYPPTGTAKTRRRPRQAIGVPAASRRDGFALLCGPLDRDAA